MKYTNYILPVLIVATLLVASVAYMQPFDVQAKVVEDDFVIILDTPIPTSAVIKKATDNNINLVQLESTFNMNGQVISDMYVVKPSDVSESEIEHGFFNGRNAIANLNNKNVAEVNRLATNKEKKLVFLCRK